MLRTLLILVLLSPLCLVAQTRTFSTTGQWNVATKWSGSSIADVITENATINSSRTATIISTDNYTIGTLTPNSTSTVTINAGGKLTLGALGTPKNVNGSAFDHIVFNISGTLEVWGNFNLGDQGTLNIPAGGILIIHGNFTSSNQLTASVGGTVSVTGTTTVGGGSVLNLSGSGSWTTASCSGAAGFCNNVLPIELLFFKVTKADENGVELNWATVSELNFDFFSLNKSIDGIHFNEISKVQGHGTTTDYYEYSFIDPIPHLGKTYYRLTAVDFDGYRETFKVITIELGGQKNIKISPNPVVDNKINLQYNFDFSGEINLSIYDVTGACVSQYSFLSQSSNQQIDLNLSAGTYIIKYRLGDLAKVERLIVK